MQEEQEIEMEVAVKNEMETEKEEVKDKEVCEAVDKRSSAVMCSSGSDELGWFVLKNDQLFSKETTPSVAGSHPCS